LGQRAVSQSQRCIRPGIGGSPVPVRRIGSGNCLVPALLCPVSSAAFVCKSLFGTLDKRNSRIRAGFCCTAVVLGRIGPLFSPIQPLFGLFGPMFGLLCTSLSGG
jgi:hypothetical protein